MELMFYKHVKMKIIIDKNKILLSIIFSVLFLPLIAQTRHIASKPLFRDTIYDGAADQIGRASCRERVSSPV